MSRLSESWWTLFAQAARGEGPAAVARTRRVAAGCDPEALTQLDEAALWALHRSAMTSLRTGETGGAGGASLLDLKAELGQRLLGPCRLCWLRCPVDRRQGERGRCGLGSELPVYQDFVHLGEELELIPTHAVYLGGCNYRCAYCSEWEHVVRPERDPPVAPQRLARSIDARRSEGALSLSFVGGLPDVNLPGILRTLQGMQVSTPVVWNSNLSATPEAHDLLEGVVDCYVADLKYGSEACARAGSQVEGSLDVVHRNLRRVVGEAYLIVRHLVLPGHLDCCTRPALDWLAGELPSGVRANLMPHYQPPRQVRGTEWDQRPTTEDLQLARDHAQALGLELTGPGRLSLPEGATLAAPTMSPPVTSFQSTIRITPDGELIIEDLDPELADLARELDAQPELEERREAASPWLGRTADSVAEPDPPA